MTTIKAPLAFEIVTGNTAVQVAPANIGGGVITNPANPADQGIDTAEDLIIGPIDAPPSAGPGVGNNKYFTIPPGGSWNMIPGQDTATFANAVTSGHKFSAIYW